MNFRPVQAYIAAQPQWLFPCSHQNDSASFFPSLFDACNFSLHPTNFSVLPQTQKTCLPWLCTVPATAVQKCILSARTCSVYSKAQKWGSVRLETDLSTCPSAVLRLSASATFHSMVQGFLRQRGLPRFWDLAGAEQEWWSMFHGGSHRGGTDLSKETWFLFQELKPLLPAPQQAMLTCVEFCAIRARWALAQVFLHDIMHCRHPLIAASLFVLHYHYKMWRQGDSSG